MGLIWREESAQTVSVFTSPALSFSYMLYSRRGLTLESMQEVVNGVLVQLEGLVIALLAISISGLLDQFNRFLQEGT